MLPNFPQQRFWTLVANFLQKGQIRTSHVRRAMAENASTRARSAASSSASRDANGHLQNPRADATRGDLVQTVVLSSWRMPREGHRALVVIEKPLKYLQNQYVSPWMT